MLSRDSGLPHDTRSIVGTSGNVFERPTCSRRTNLYSLQQSKKSASSSQELRPDNSRKYKATGKWNETRTTEFVNTCTTFPKWRWIVKSYWWNLFSRWYDWLSEIPDFGIASRKISWLYGTSKLESQLQNWSMFKISRSSPHNALNQRCWESKVNWRTYDIAIDCGAKRFLRLWYAWCDACVCIDKTCRQAHSLLQKSKCRRAACSENTTDSCEGDKYCLHDLRASPCIRSLWSGTRFIRFVQNTFAEWRRPRLRRSMGSSSIIKRYAFRCDPGKIVQVKITGLCSTSDCIGLVWSRTCSKRWTDKSFTIDNVWKT